MNDIKIYPKSHVGKQFLIMIIAMIGMYAYVGYKSGIIDGVLNGDGENQLKNYLPFILIVGYFIFMLRKSIWKRPSLILDQNGITNQIDKKNVEFVRWTDVERAEISRSSGYESANIYVEENRNSSSSSIIMDERSRKKTYIVQNPMTIMVGNLKYDSKALINEINRRKR